MSEKVGQEEPQSSAADQINPAMNAPRVLGEIRGIDDALAVIAAESAARGRLMATARKASEQVLAATPQQRAAGMIERAANYLGPDATVRQMAHVENHIKSFERTASEFLERGDCHALDSAIATFWNGIRDADKLAPPKPPLMPPGDTVFYLAGWSTEAEHGLRAILLKGLNGVMIGDRCVAVDADGATLASGARVSRKQALAAYVAPAGGKMIAVGSFPAVMNAIARAQS
jgi:hypothetical protein